MENIPKISVIVFTYNHENYINRALESVLVQKDYVFEIIVSDDYSTDNNWQIIQDYKNKYPKIIKVYQNEENLGIFKHLEKTWSYPVGDLIISLAGDDIICKGLFKTAIDFIKKEKIDYRQGAFCIYSDSKIIFPDGKEKMRSNEMISKGHDALSLKIRGLIGSSRGVLKSREIYKRYKSPEKNIGIYTDGLYDTQVQMNSDRNYYIPFIGGIYYAGIGIAHRTPHAEVLKSLLLRHEHFYKTLNLGKKDKYYLLYQKESTSFWIAPSLINFIKTWKYYLLSINFKYGLYGLKLKTNIKIFIKMLILLLKGKKK